LGAPDSNEDASDSNEDSVLFLNGDCFLPLFDQRMGLVFPIKRVTELDLPKPGAGPPFLVFRWREGRFDDWTESYRRGVKGTIDDTDPSINYTGSWNAGRFGGKLWTEHITNQPNASARLRFKGTWFTVVGGRNPGCGLADVYVDGQLQRRTDWQSTVWRYHTPARFGPFSDDWHEVEVRALGRNREGKSAAVVIEAFEVPDQEPNDK
jgi:hypothetical protein